MVGEGHAAVAVREPVRLPDARLSVAAVLVWQVEALGGLDDLNGFDVARGGSATASPTRDDDLEEISSDGSDAEDATDDAAGEGLNLDADRRRVRVCAPLSKVRC